MKQLKKITSLFKIFLLIFTLFGCTPTASIKAPPGATVKEMRLHSLPSGATVYVDGKQVGNTPIILPLWYQKKRVVQIVLIPQNPQHFKQVLNLPIPEVPHTMTIYMDRKTVSTNLH